MRRQMPVGVLASIVEPEPATSRLMSMAALRATVLAVVAAILLVACSAGSNGAGSGAPGAVAGAPDSYASARGAVSGALSRRDLVGTWRPLVLLGRDVHRVGRINGSPVTVTFRLDPRLGWTGYDGCNWTNGPFRVDTSGRFAATARSTTLRGCYPRELWTANVIVMTRADRVELRDGRLILYGPRGRRIGTYVRST